MSSAASDPAELIDPFPRPAPRSQRRSRRDDVVTYQVRVDFAGTKPPLWRRLELASDLMEHTTGLTATVTRFLDAIGWMSADRTPLTDAAGSHASWRTKAVLCQLGAFGDNRTFGGDARLTPEGVDFARAALRTWPDT